MTFAVVADKTFGGVCKRRGGFWKGRRGGKGGPISNLQNLNDGLGISPGAKNPSARTINSNRHLSRWSSPSPIHL
jgi:hypothetical protein